MNHQELRDAIENMIDHTSLDSVLAALIEVCQGKAEHLAANWQDQPAAKRWTLVAARIDLCRRRFEV